MMDNLIQAEQSVSELPVDWDIVFDSGIPEQETQTQHIPDALVHCLTTLGRVDIDYIAALTGTDCKTVIAALKGAIYQNPLTWNGSFYEGWETADEYLSGNLIKKRQEARAANAKFSGLFADNIEAIDAVLPPAVAADDIYVTLGSPWLPADLIDEFIRTVFGKPRIRVWDVRHGRVRRTEDNLLTITGDGRKAALDLRLVQQDQPFTLQSKVARCAEHVTEIYYKTAENRCTQLVFCDVSTPKAGFNLYTELKRLLMEQGIAPEQIAFIHDADTEKKRSAIFAKMRRGDVRILIGSTFKLGLGVNIQERLIALHHLDVPWRPADMTQREGRILRQGNTNSKVFIYRYITEGSFDAYSWQLLETKQRFINDLLSGSLTARSGSDVEDTVLNYAEVKALAIGNPLVKKRVEAANELSRYQMLQRKAIESRTRLEQELAGLPEQIRQQQENVRKCEDDAAFYAELQVQEQSALTKEQTAAARRALRELLADVLKQHEDQPEEKDLYTLCGFRIVLPAHMTRERPYVWLKRSGAYYVGLGGNETGNLIRIENRLNGLNEHLAHLRAELTRLKEKQADLQAELAQAETYSEQIALYAEKVARLDKKLGVNKK